MVSPPAPEPVEMRILELAAHHIRTYGMRRTKIVAIAEDAGMSHANIYRYFPSKTALIDAVTDFWLKPIEAGLRDIADGPDPAYDKLERILSALHRAYREKLDNDANIFEIFASATAQSTGISRRHRNRVMGEIQRVIDEGMASGAFAAGDQRRAIALVFDTLFRFLHPVAVHLDRETRSDQLKSRFDRAIPGLLRSLVQGIR
ncbi:MAG: TetR family transcriptional regulator [Beijerinckiaceae bacterium]|mgnify:CR=1 FL=1|jgi:AcrR family transcriptional regulator|nr:TetR family transcriptional regulator [Beijerinckiaceae bacterium]